MQPAGKLGHSLGPEEAHGVPKATAEGGQEQAFETLRLLNPSKSRQSSSPCPPLLQHCVPTET